MYQLEDKQPYEEIPGAFFDFRNRLMPGESIESATVICDNPAMLGAGSVSFSGTVVTWKIIGGNHGDTAIFTVRVVGSLGSKREAEMHINVVET